MIRSTRAAAEAVVEPRCCRGASGGGRGSGG
uniref:Uncharacterized protein n=1 Tax=Arundo donax TaxID=35708 RepID=A0A0A9HGM1_ARUDO